MLFSASGYGRGGRSYNSSSSSNNNNSTSTNSHITNNNNNHITNNNTVSNVVETLLLNDSLPEEIEQQHLKRQEEKARNIAIAFAVGGIFLLITFTYSLLDKCIDENVPTFLVIIYVIPYNCIGLILAIGIILICNTSKSTRHVIHCVRWTGVVIIFTVFIITHMLVIILYWRGYYTSSGNGLSSFTLFASYIVGLIPILRVKSFMDKWVIYKDDNALRHHHSNMRNSTTTTTTLTFPFLPTSSDENSTSSIITSPRNSTTSSVAATNILHTHHGSAPRSGHHGFGGGPTPIKANCGGGHRSRCGSNVSNASIPLHNRNDLPQMATGMANTAAAAGSPVITTPPDPLNDPPPPSYNEAMKNIIIETKQKEKKVKSTKSSPITKL